MKFKPPYEGKTNTQKNVCVIKIAFYNFPSYGKKSLNAGNSKMLCFKKNLCMELITLERGKIKKSDQKV
jgi:hypothetical protein